MAMVMATSLLIQISVLSVVSVACFRRRPDVITRAIPFTWLKTFWLKDWIVSLRGMPPVLSKSNVKHQLTPFDIGQVKAHMEHGLSAAAISLRVFKAAGGTFGETAIQNCMNKLKATPRWRGSREVGSGPPRKKTAKQDKDIIRWLLKERGKQKVSVSKIKKEFVFLRKLSDGLVLDRLHDAKLKWLRRCSKSIVTKKEHLEARVAYSRGIKRKREETLCKFAYTDGTVYYLDRTDDELEHSQRRALGTHVWRRSDNKDARFQDCLGPSNYSKGQGLPVKVWGMLACGVLNIHVLDEGETMNQMLYSELVEDKFEEWCGYCEHLVCDFESCLRSDAALHALSKTPLKLVEDYPMSSQDFNAIENAWAIVKERLDQTMPTELESRDVFIKRLKAAVRWVNQHRKEQLWYRSINQKERADECLAAKPPGGRTSW